MLPPGNGGIGRADDVWNAPGPGGKSGDAAPAAAGDGSCGWWAPGQLKSCGGGRAAAGGGCCLSGNGGVGEAPREDEKSWERKKPDW
jgi:hypothetical protein